MRLNQTLVIRYSLLVRVTALVPCFVLAAAIAKGSVSTSTILVMVAVLCPATLICARRVEIDSAQVRCDAPFYTRDTPVRDIIHLVEDRTHDFGDSNVTYTFMGDIRFGKEKHCSRSFLSP